MRVIIAGSRSIEDYSTVSHWATACGFPIAEVVSGAARGVDRLGEQWARESHIPVKRFAADWDRHGKSAGYIRNVDMANYADALLLVWDGESKGSANMKAIMEAAGKPIFEAIVVDKGPD